MTVSTTADDALTRMVNSMVSTGVPRDKAECVARKHLGLPPLAVPIAANDTRSEKQIERDCDTLMQQLGFEVIRFSHPGKTRQTEGIADRLYLRRHRSVGCATCPDGRVIELMGGALSVWVELKSATGRQRPGQKLFQELVTDAGHEYVCGGIDALVQWLVAQRLGSVVNGNFTSPP